MTAASIVVNVTTSATGVTNGTKRFGGSPARGGRVRFADRWSKLRFWGFISARKERINTARTANKRSVTSLTKGGDRP